MFYEDFEHFRRKKDPTKPKKLKKNTKMPIFGHFAKLRPGKTLALAEPEARHYNHQATTAPPAAANVCIGYISAISQRNELKFCTTVI